MLNKYAHEAHQTISGKKEKLKVHYHPSVADIEVNDSVEMIYQKILNSFQKNKNTEIRKGTTLTGPHRDDLEFFIDGKNAHDYASQGQQRTIALSMKLAEINVVHQLTHEYPVLLLDDVMSELDHTRQSSLLSYIHGKTQTFITTTDLEGISWEIVKAPKVFQISNGVISKEEN